MRDLSRRFRYEATAVVATLSVLALLAAMAGALVRARSETTSTITYRFHLRVESSAAFVGSYVTSMLMRAGTVADSHLAASPGASELQLVCSVLAFDHCEVTQRGRAVARWGDAATLAAAAHAGVLQQAGASRVAVAALFGGPSSPERVAIAARLGPRAARRFLIATVPLDETPLPSFLHRIVTTGHFQVLLVDQRGGVIEATPALPPTALGRFSPALAGLSRAGSDGQYQAPAGPLSYTSATVPGTAWRLVVAEPQAELYATAGGLQAIVPWFAFGAVAVLAGVLLFLFLRSLRSRRALQASWARMEREASTDALTGLANRRHLEAALREHAHRASAYSVLMIDLDDLKQVNDGFGHAAGDGVLRQVADLMRATFDGGAVFGRWGGDEFLAVLPGAGPLDAAAASARLQRAARELRTMTPAHHPAPSLTIGAATSAPDTDVLDEADRALYEAKAARNRRTADLLS
jgi:diguanylate cyclase (GGDEF)-like protein